jgi:hypothetical protein
MQPTLRVGGRRLFTLEQVEIIAGELRRVDHQRAGTQKGEPEVGR